MGLIREPKDVDFVVAPSVLTEQDRNLISEIIAEYKLTGKIPKVQKENSSSIRAKRAKKSISVR